MANLINEVSGNMGDFLWGSMGNIVTVIVVVLLTVLFFGFFALIIWWKSHNYKVTIYTPVGQISEDIKKEVTTKLKNKAFKGAINVLKDNKILFNRIRTKKTCGKYTSSKGVQYFQTFMPMLKLQPIPLYLLYDDGIHVIRLSKNILVPIKKPNITVEIDKEIMLHVDDSTQWQTWSNLMSDRINNKYQDLDVQKKVILFFITGIVMLTVLGGIIIWLIYKSATRGYDEANSFFDLMNKLGNSPQ